MRRCAGFCLLFATLLASAAHAAEPKRAVVFVSPRNVALEPVLADRFARRQIDLRVERRSSFNRDELLSWAQDPSAPSTLVRVWIDVADGRVARLVFAHPARERFAIRVVPLRAGLDEVARETIGTVVESAVDSLLSGTTFELTRGEAATTLDAPAPVTSAAPPPLAPPSVAPPPVTPPPPPERPIARAERPVTPPPLAPAPTVAAKAEPPAPASPTRWTAMAGWVAHTLAPPDVTFASGPSLAVAAKRGRWLALAEGAYLLPAELAAQPLGASLQAASLRLGVGTEAACGVVCLTAVLRAGLDATLLEPTAAAAGATAASARTLWSPIAGLRVGVVWRRKSFEATLAATLDADLLGTRLVADEAGRQSTVTDLARLRPGLTALVGFGR